MKTKLTIALLALAAVASSSWLGCELRVKIGSTPITNALPVSATNALLGYPVMAVRTNLPPRWQLLCDGNGNYGFRYPNGMVSTIERKSRQEVIDWVWSILDVPQKPEKPDWRDCE